MKKLVYEAYDGMAEKSMKKICSEIRSQWKVHGIAIYHRLGEVPVEEASIAIAISSEHRAESLQAVQFAIDRVKAEVPIWKKEEYAEEGDYQWKENKECSWIKTEPQDCVDGENDRVSSFVDDVSSELIQVKASDAELKRRMEAFMDYKRNQVNQSNIRDFCGNANDASTCARVDAVVVRQKDSKGHLRVRRVLNKTGPQTQGIEQWPGGPGAGSIIPNSVQNSPFKFENKPRIGNDEPKIATTSCPPAIEERLRNAELHLGLNNALTNRPVPKDVYARLKDLEDRILFLEGTSPEYAQALPNIPKIEPFEKKPKIVKKVYSVSDLERKMREIQKAIDSNSPVKQET